MRPVAAFACGLLWALLRAQMLLADPLPSDWGGVDTVVEGRVVSVPDRRARRVRFGFEIERVVDGSVPATPARRVLISWYNHRVELRAGERWLLRVRLRRPHGFANPGGFDYEGWLFRQRYAATGYVRALGPNRRLGEAPWSLLALRARLGERIDLALAEKPKRAIVKALALGLRADLSPESWAVLRRTGTSHLMAISGLHVGLVAGLAFAVAGWLWSRCARCVVLIPAPRVAAGAALVAALGYAAMAGFAVPTQRAVVMVGVLMAALIAGRQVRPSAVLARAAMVVVIVDPFAVSAPGFWLSFLAVAAIFFGMSARPVGPSSTGRRLWRRFIAVQILLAVALAPLSLLYFGEHPLSAPLANVVAVPWVGGLVVPTVLIGTLALLAWPPAGQAILAVAHLELDLLWPWLDRLADSDAMLPGAAAAFWHPLAGLIGVAILLSPRGVPARWLGVVWMLPMFFSAPPAPPAGALWLTVLDVGQGLAVVARTRRHVLLYDTGPRFSERFDAGAAAVVPFLHHRGLRRVDTLVLSHHHRDHAGGMSSVLERVSVDLIMTNAKGWRGRALACRAGVRWDWDGVEFSILHPPRGRHATGNAGSCVLRIAVGSSAVLLPGDIERPSELALVQRDAEGLRADVLLIPHHGSRTSSSPAFLDAVQPGLALLSVGYRNRFALPADVVMARYRARDVLVLDTATAGAIHLEIDADGSWSMPRRYRESARRYWHWRAPL